MVETLKKQQEEIASLKALLMQKKETEDAPKIAEHGDFSHDQLDLSGKTPLLLSRRTKRKSLASNFPTVNVSPHAQIQTHGEHTGSSNDIDSHKKQRGQNDNKPQQLAPYSDSHSEEDVLDKDGMEVENQIQKGASKRSATIKPDLSDKEGRDPKYPRKSSR